MKQIIYLFHAIAVVLLMIFLISIADAYNTSSSNFQIILEIQSGSGETSSSNFITTIAVGQPVIGSPSSSNFQVEFGLFHKIPEIIPGAVPTPAPKQASPAGGGLNCPDNSSGFYNKTTPLCICDDGFKKWLNTSSKKEECIPTLTQKAITRIKRFPLRLPKLILFTTLFTILSLIIYISVQYIIGNKEKKQRIKQNLILKWKKPKELYKYFKQEKLI